MSRPDPSQMHLVHEESRVTRLPTPFVFGRDPGSLCPEMGLVRTAWWKARAYAEEIALTGDWASNWGRQAARHLEPALNADRYDAVILDIPPLAAVAPVARAAARHGTPVIADFRDLWLPLPQGAKAGARRLHPAHRRALTSDAAIREVMRVSAAVVYTSREATEYARTAFRLRATQGLHTVPNAFDEADEDVRAPTSRSPVRLVYAGSLSYGRDRLMVAFIRGLARYTKSGADPMAMTLVGDMPSHVDAEVKAHHLEGTITMLPWMNRDEVVELQRSAHGLLLLQPAGDPSIENAIPAKLFEYMARRRNILSLAPKAGDRVVADHGLGEVAAQLDPDEIAQAIARFVTRVRETPVLPPPPAAYSAETTAGEFMRIVEAHLDEELVRSSDG